jgi:hypothetical protein
LYINFDLVHYVDENASMGVRIFFSEEENSGAEILQLRGEEATAMKKWLRQNSMEVKLPVKDWRTPSVERAEIGG